jgi:hypothetical protein
VIEGGSVKRLPGSVQVGLTVKLVFSEKYSLREADEQPFRDLSPQLLVCVSVDTSVLRHSLDV